MGNSKKPIKSSDALPVGNKVLTGLDGASTFNVAGFDAFSDMVEVRLHEQPARLELSKESKASISADALSYWSFATGIKRKFFGSTYVRLVRPGVLRITWVWKKK